MSKSPKKSGPPEVFPHDDFSCTYLDASAPAASQTDLTSPSKSLGNDHLYDDNALSYSGGASSDYETYDTDEERSAAPYMYGGVYGQDDIVGRHLAFQAALQSERLLAPAPYHISEHAGYLYPGYQLIAARDSHINTQLHHRYPDTESIRHLHTVHSLLPHIQPERKLNALSGPVLDIHSGSNTGPILCLAVPKKLLVLFLGRSVVSRYLHTISRQDNTGWAGPPTQQSLILPSTIASSSALTILVAWMTRACKHATMSTMRPLAVPKNLFAACTLAQTMDLLGLKRDAYRVDMEISRRLRSKRLFAVEVETLWRCLGESNRYVYAAVKAFGKQARAASTLAPASVATEESACGAPEGLQTSSTASTTASELLELKDRYPRLYDRIRNDEVNEQFAPQFGRNWFDNLAGRGGEEEEEEEEEAANLSTPSTHSPPATSTKIHGTRNSSSDSAHTGGRNRGGSAASPSARPLDPQPEVFRPAAAAWRDI
ncbi:hypothetical protein G6514_005261 [Epicoccum nigrum]|nr:hypothetical protein G6514_005261 [Epicoccum nigrum]